MRIIARHTTIRPILRFVYQYFWRFGFLDGRAGLLYCYLISGYEAFILAKEEENRVHGVFSDMTGKPNNV